jgi:tripartite-type tricarboxylate transporter receptor subunit TctC
MGATSMLAKFLTGAALGLAVLSATAVNAPDVRERFTAIGVEPASKSSEEMARYLKSEIEKYGTIVRAIGLKID